MYRVASRLPRRALLAGAVGVGVVDKRDKLSIYSASTPDVLLVEETSPLEQQIGAARRQVQGAYSDAHAYLQGWISKWIGIEHAVEHRVKSIISPNESLTPGLLYVGVATLTGSILSRNRFILTRFILPPLFLVVSANQFLPQTTHNLSEYFGSLEDTYFPTLAQKHEIGKAHSAMGWEMLKESTRNARTQVNNTALTAVEKIQGATGLKIKETLGLGGEVKKVEVKVADVVVTEKTPVVVETVKEVSVSTPVEEEPKRLVLESFFASMESLNLNTLVSSLPSQQNAEKQLMNDFKAAALSITTLYRSSRKNAKRAYNAGYATACQDLLNFIQHGVSTSTVEVGGASSEVEGGGMTIGRVMDWTEARLDAIKALEEDEDEDEERETQKERGRSANQPSAASKPEAKKSSGNAAASSSRISAPTLPTPSSPHVISLQPPEPESPSPTPSTTLRPTHQQRHPKVRTPGKTEPVIPFVTQSSNIPPAVEPFTTPAPSSVSFPESPMVIGAGGKRRHAVMMMMDSTGPTSVSASPALSIGAAPGNAPGHGLGASGALSSRRRTRSTRNLGHAMQPSNQNFNFVGAQASAEAMDVEEEGRERKRVARR
ncbi:hypothetical protein MD484_g4026, partial [Candolleomyces efflorescens]